ncbi:MAG: hypothetical protein KY468_05255 [Armatimonadetes bacterium]|nr:hypothetical protein [Armatimonadota bacterium]
MKLYRGSGGSPIRLDTASALGAGGEAKIYSVSGDPSLVAKLYHAPTEVHARKLAAMLSDPPTDPTARRWHTSIAWPVDTLHSAPGGACVGFLMPRVSGMKPVFEFYNPRARREQCPFFDTLYLHRAARNLAAVVAALHDRGYVIGDVNESNLLVAETALVTLVDTDSFQVRDPKKRSVYRCPVGKPDFTPPELQGVSFSKVNRGPEHDRFGLAVLLFHLLMEGTHPFDGKRRSAGESTLRHERIRAGHFPYKGGRRIPYEPSPSAPPLEVLHPELRELFLRCFAKGHRNPNARPDAREWQDALAEAEAALVPCNANPHHQYGRHLRSCPWCARTLLLGGRDPFPATLAAASVPPPAKKSAPAPASPAPAGTNSPKPTKTARPVSVNAVIAPIPSGAAAFAPPSFFSALRAKLPRPPAFPLKRLELKMPSVSPPTWAGVMALLRTPIHSSPTAWTGMTVLFALLAGVPGLGLWAGLSAVGCGAMEDRRTNWVTVGSVLGVGWGAGMAVKALFTKALLLLSLILPLPALKVENPPSPPPANSTGSMKPGVTLYSSMGTKRVWRVPPAPHRPITPSAFRPGSSPP